MRGPTAALGSGAAALEQARVWEGRKGEHGLGGRRSTANSGKRRTELTGPPDRPSSRAGRWEMVPIHDILNHGADACSLMPTWEEAVVALPSQNCAYEI